MTQAELPGIKLFDVGITGTRRGLTTKQHNTLDTCLSKAHVAGWTQLIHGSCHGVDEEAGELARLIGLTVHEVPVSLEQQGRAAERQGLGLSQYVPAVLKDYWTRNEFIAANCRVLVACPMDDQEMRRGGTWHCVRAARKLGTPIRIIWPNGQLTKENPTK